MKSSAKKFIQLGLVLALLSGCATTGTKNTDPMKTDTTRTEVEGAAVGTAIGAGVGALLGAVIGGEEGAKLGAAFGGVLGLAGGAILGGSVAGQKQEYVLEEERLNSEIKMAVTTNAQLRDYNSKTEARIASLDTEISSLKASNDKRKINAGQLEQKQRELLASIRDAEQQKRNKENELTALNESLANLAALEQQPKFIQLEKEVDELKANLAILDNNNKQMAKMADSLTVRK